MKKEPAVYQDFGTIDTVVQEMVNDGKRRENNRHRTKRAARQARIDAARNRRYIDIPTELEEQIETLASLLGVPFSQVLARVAAIGLGHTDLETLKGDRVPSRSMRFQHNIDWRGKR